MFAKRVLFLTDHRLVSVLWKRGRAIDPHVFPLTEEGRVALARHLALRADVPTYLLAELVAEDFRTDTIPHVISRDQHAIVDRKLSQIYRATPYRLGLIRGREPDGRRDNRVLYTAITNPELVRPWIELLIELGVPVAGVYTTPLVSGGLLRALRLAGGHILLASVELGGNLRQSYFHRGELKFSRLTPSGEVWRQETAVFVGVEVAKTWQYLDSLRYFSRADILDVYVLAHRDDHAALLEHAPVITQLRYQTCDIAVAAARVGMLAPPEESDATALFIHLLARRPPREHFATHAETHGMRVWRARVGLHAAALAVIAGVLLFGLYSALDLHQASIEVAQMEQEAARITARHRQLATRLPATPVPGSVMRDSVKLYDVLISNAPMPASALQRLSDVLDRFPRISLQQLAWGLTADASGLPEFTPLPAEERGQVVSRTLQPAASAASARPSGAGSLSRNEVMVIEGDVALAGGDYRDALDELQRFAAELRAKPWASEIKVLREPLDTRPSASMSGRAASDATPSGQAGFAIRVGFREGRS